MFNASRLFIIVTFALVLAASARQATFAQTPPTITKTVYGTTDGETVYEYVLDSGNNMQVHVISYGGIITAVHAPDRAGKVENVALGFDTLEEYVTKNSPHFGSMIGRYGNRIANGVFQLNGVWYCLDPNNGVNTLHGGFRGFDTFVWQETSIVTGTNSVSLELAHASPAGDGWTGQVINPACKPNSRLGFPGNLDVSVTYTLNDQNQLILDYMATTDEPTVLNLTNHTYWNLEGEGTSSILDHLITIHSNEFTPVGATQIPTGTVESVLGTVFDFTSAKAVDEDIRDDDPQLVTGEGYDHNWVLPKAPEAEASDDDATAGLVLAATVTDPDTGRELNVWTNQPAVQFYAGNSLDGSLYGTSERQYRESDGLALETQHYPDSPNHPEFPSTVLNPGETFTSRTIFELGTDSQ